MNNKLTIRGGATAEIIRSKSTVGIAFANNAFFRSLLLLSLRFIEILALDMVKVLVGCRWLVSLRMA